MKILRWVETQYAHLRLLSIDVAFAGLGAGIMAVRLVGSHPRPAFYFVLPLSIWVVYTLDHLLDAERTGPLARNPRHLFHCRHASVLGVVVGTAATLCLLIGWEELSWPSLAYCTAVGVLFILHELLVSKVGPTRSPWLIKEFGVAIIFTAGTWVFPSPVMLWSKGSYGLTRQP